MVYLNGKEILFPARITLNGAVGASLVQTTGDSETSVMSQKAVTREFAERDTRIEGLDYKIYSHEIILTNLTDALDPKYVVTDRDSAYEKIVPSNVCTYATLSKVGGMSCKCKNLIEYPYISGAMDDYGVERIPLSDGGIKIDGTTNERYVTFEIMSGSTLTSKLKNGVTYTLSSPIKDAPTNKVRLLVWCKRVKDDVSIKFWGESGDNETFTWTNAYYVHRVYLQIEQGVTLDRVIYPMLNEGTKALPYEQYHKGLRDTKVTEIKSKSGNFIIDTKQIPSEIQALDGYGEGINSTYNNYIDFERKVFVQKVKSVDMGDLSSYCISLGHTFMMVLPDLLVIDGVSETALCDKYSLSPSMEDKTMYFDTEFRAIAFINMDYEYDAEAFCNAMRGVELIYPLTTPIETDISAYLTDDDYMKVMGGGSIVVENERADDVPSEITYLKRL